MSEHHKNAGPTTNIMQQWQRLEKKTLEDPNIRDLVIICLSQFIHNLQQQQQHKVIIVIDANEANDKPKNGVDKLLHLTKFIDVISQQHGIRKEPNTYLRGSKRIDLIFCSKHISTFTDNSGINPFNEITSSNHRGLFLDLRLTSFLKKSYTALPDHTSRPLKSFNTQSVIKYKRNVRRYVINHKNIEQADDLQKNSSATPYLPKITTL